MRRLLLIGAAMLLGLFCETAIRGKPIDFAFPGYIFVCLIVGSFILLAYDPPVLPSLRSLWLFVPPVFFAFNASLTAEWPGSLKHVLSLAFTFLYLALLSITYVGGRLHDFCLFDYLHSLWRLAINIILQPIQFIQEWIQGTPLEDNASLSYARRIVFWLLVALFSLFLLADSAFRQFHHTSLWNYTREQFGGRVSVWGVLLWSYIILGTFLYAISLSQNSRLYSDEPLYFRRWLSYTNSGLVFSALLFPLLTFTVLRIFSVLDTFFNLGVLYGGIEARYGFWTLGAASGIVFLVVCWLNHVTIFNSERDRLDHTIISFLLFMFVMFLLGVAWWSVSMGKTIGIATNSQVGYARLGLFWLGSMFLLFNIYQAIHRERFYPFAALVMSSVIFAVYVLGGWVVYIFS